MAQVIRYICSFHFIYHCREGAEISARNFNPWAAILEGILYRGLWPKAVFLAISNKGRLQAIFSNYVSNRQFNFLHFACVSPTFWKYFDHEICKITIRLCTFSHKPCSGIRKVYSLFSFFEVKTFPKKVNSTHEKSSTPVCNELPICYIIWK